MKCKSCKREIPNNSIFCNWCGKRQITEATEISVPKPIKSKTGYYNRVMVNGVRYPVSAETEAEYYIKARAVKANIAEIKKTPSKAKLGDVIDNYIESNRNVLPTSTIRTYQIKKKHLGDWVKKPIESIDYQKMISDLSGHYAPATVHCVWAVVSKSVKYYGLQPPMVNLPTREYKDPIYLNYEQIGTFLSQIYGKRLELQSILALHSLRESEIMGVCKTGLSAIRNNHILVRGSVVLGEGNKYVSKKTNKNQTSTREVPIMIPRLLEIWDEEHIADILAPNSLRVAIKRTCLKADLPPCNCHSIRHSFASLAYHLNWDIKTTCKIGGWKNETTLLKIYTHIAKADEDNSIAKMKQYYENYQ